MSVAWHQQARAMRANGDTLIVISATLHKAINSVRYAVIDENARERWRAGARRWWAKHRAARVADRFSLPQRERGR